MDELGFFNLLGFGWLYDRVEERYGAWAALLVTIAGAIAIIATLALAFIVITRMI